MATPNPPAAQPTGAPLATWGTRALGFLIDYVPIILLQIIFSGSAVMRGLLGLVGIGYTILLGYLDGLNGQTPGKAMMGIRLVNADGNNIGAGPGIGRKFVHILDSIICGLGYLLPLVDSKRQTIADKVMTTYVVTGAEKKQFSVDLWMPPKS